MAISTNSIIHYTKSIDILKSILKEGFRIKYCSESLLIKGTPILSAHPMISFCDIPLSNSLKHIYAYGSYGIGLTKVWACKMGINPVLYVEKNSIIGQSFLDQLKKIRTNSIDNLNYEDKLFLHTIKAFSKNYSGPLKRKNVDDPNYKFYDEREWRLVPKPEEIGNNAITIPVSTYEKDKAKYNKKLSMYRFKFEPDDISYLIVEKESEITSIINFLQNEYSNSWATKKMDLLFTKISSIEQIKNDY